MIAHYVQMRQISKSFPGVQALDSAQLDVSLGQVHALLGENGAGKSTLMKILSGVYPPDKGGIFINDRQVSFHNTREAEAEGIAIIHQELLLIPELTVAENIYLGREPKNRFGLVDYKTMRINAQTELQQVGADIPVETRVGYLRVGEQQLVEIAKALSLRAKVVIMDEPTSALSSNEVQKLFSVIRQLVLNNVAVIYITHKLDEIFTIAQKVTVLRDGKFIGVCDVQKVTANQLVNMMVGRDLAALFPKTRVSDGEELLRVENLSVKHPVHSHRYLLRDINLSVRRGEIVGIAGLMGSGRTELLMTLFGAPPGKVVSGRIFIHNRAVDLQSPSQAIKYGIALVSEDRKRTGLFMQLSVLSNISIASLRQAMKYGVLIRALERAVAKKCVDYLRIRVHNLDAGVSNLSGGNQQKVVLARWLNIQPSVLLLDDPTRGIDVGAKAEIYQSMNKFAQQGMGILLVSSELPEILALSDRIIVLGEGRLTAEFRGEEASEEKIMTAATQVGGK